MASRKIALITSVQISFKTLQRKLMNKYGCPKADYFYFHKVYIHQQF